MGNFEFNKYILGKATSAKSSCRIEMMKKVISESFNSAPNEFSSELRTRIYQKLKPNTTISPIQNFKMPICLIYMTTIQEIAIEGMQSELNYKVSANFVNRYMSKKQLTTYRPYTELKPGLNIQSLLDIIGYSLDIAEQLDVPVEDIQSGVVGLKVINRVFSNEENDTFTIKDLGLAVEIVVIAAKYFTENKDEKNYIGLSSTLFNLAIDLFTKN